MHWSERTIVMKIRERYLLSRLISQVIAAVQKMQNSVPRPTCPYGTSSHHTSTSFRVLHEIPLQISMSSRLSNASSGNFCRAGQISCPAAFSRL